MALFDVFKVSRKTFINPKGWFGWRSLKEQTTYTLDVARDLYSLPTPTHHETFEEALERLSLTEKDIQKGMKRYRIYAIVFLLLGLCIFYYSFFLLFRYHRISNFFIGIGAAGLAIAQAFQFDFWHFQMSRRKLGATFKDWLHGRLGG